MSFWMQNNAAVSKELGTKRVAQNSDKSPARCSVPACRSDISLTAFRRCSQQCCQPCCSASGKPCAYPAHEHVAAGAEAALQCSNAACVVVIAKTAFRNCSQKCCQPCCLTSMHAAFAASCAQLSIYLFYMHAFYPMRLPQPIKDIILKNTKSPRKTRGCEPPLLCQNSWQKEFPGG